MENNFIFEAFFYLFYVRCRQTHGRRRRCRCRCLLSEEIHAECRSEFIMLPYLSGALALASSICHSSFKSEALRNEILKVYRGG